MERKQDNSKGEMMEPEIREQKEAIVKELIPQPDIGRLVTTLELLLDRVNQIFEKQRERERSVLLTPDEAADFLAIKKTLLFKLARSGELPRIKFGGKEIRFSRDALERWIEKQENPLPRRKRRF